MTDQQAALVERVRASLQGEPSIREVSMFGSRSIMVDDRLLVGAMKDGSLLVRVAPERHELLLERPGATQAEMGTGRSMGPGWISVSSTALATDEHLEFWLAEAREHHRATGHG